MNLGELRSSGDWPFALELHPRINVLMLPDPARRQRLRQMLAGLMRGEMGELSGTIWIESTNFDLEPDAIEILGIPPGIEVTITAADLPGATVIDESTVPPPEPTPTDLSPAEPATAVQDEPDMQDAPGVDDQRAEELRQAHEALERAEARLAEARAALDPDAEEFEQRARAHLDHAVAHLAAVTTLAESSTPQVEDSDRVIQIRDHLTEAEAQRRDDEMKLAGLAPALPIVVLDEIESGLQACREAEEAGPGPSPEAVALADRWADLAQRREAAGSGARPPDERSDHPARRELDEARVELTRAEHGARPLYVSPDAADELDRAHAAVAEAEDRAFRRMAGPLAKRRLEAAKQAEAEILKRIGVSSYDAYLMQSSPGMVDPEAQHQLVEAKRRVAAAESAWAEVQAEGRSPQHRALDDELAALRSQAANLLGRQPHDSTVEDELRSIVITPQPGEQWAALRSRVEGLGGHVVTGEERPSIEAWLKDARAGAEEQAELRRVLSVLDRRVDELVRDLEAARAEDAAAASADAPDPEQDPARIEAHAAVTAAEEALAEAVARAGAATAARGDVETLEQEVRKAEAHLADVAAQPSTPPGPDAPVVDSSFEAPAAPEEAEAARRAVIDVRGVGAKDAELYVLARIAAQRSVGDAGPLPLIIDEALAGFPTRAAAPILDLLSRMSGIVQVIYLTADDAIRVWAERLGPDEAAVFHFAPAGPSS